MTTNLGLILRGGLGLLLAAMMLVVGALALGQTRVDTTPTLPWARICDLPCWQGIDPGQTHYDEALVLLGNIPGLNITGDDGETIYFDFGDQTGWVQFRQARVRQIGLSGEWSFWRLYEQIGPPTCAATVDTTDENVLLIAWSRAGYSIRTALVRPLIHTLQQAGQDAHDLQIIPEDICTVGAMRAWQGFAPSWHYRP